MSSLNARRAGVVAGLPGAYDDGLLDTWTFERRLDEARTSSWRPAADRDSSWTPGTRAPRGARLRVAIEIAARRIAPPEAV
jgi:hypothetical protein